MFSASGSFSVSYCVGGEDGAIVKSDVFVIVGDNVGDIVGEVDGNGVGILLGDAVGNVGDRVGCIVGADVGIIVSGAKATYPIVSNAVRIVVVNAQ